MKHPLQKAQESYSMNKTVTIGLVATLFLGVIIAANYATTELGLVSVGLGLTATAGTYLAGIAFILRDALQDLAGKRFTVLALVLGGAISYLVADPFIALASGVAFVLSELADLAVYTPLRQRGYVRAAVTSNVIGAFVDTVLFLYIAGFFTWAAIPGQMVGKLSVTVIAVGVVSALRFGRRKAIA